MNDPSASFDTNLITSSYYNVSVWQAHFLAVYPEKVLVALPNAELPDLISMAVDAILKASDLSADEAQVRDMTRAALRGSHQIATLHDFQPSQHCMSVQCVGLCEKSPRQIRAGHGVGGEATSEQVRRFARAAEQWSENLSRP